MAATPSTIPPLLVDNRDALACGRERTRLHESWYSGLAISIMVDENHALILPASTGAGVATPGGPFAVLARKMRFFQHQIRSKTEPHAHSHTRARVHGCRGERSAHVRMQEVRGRAGGKFWWSGGHRWGVALAADECRSRDDRAQGRATGGSAHTPSTLSLRLISRAGPVD